MTPDEKQKIKEFALQAGFTERVQPDGRLDLNPYVYTFALGMLRNGMLRAAAVCFERAERLTEQRNLAETTCGHGAGTLYRVSRDEADQCKTLIRIDAERLGGA